MNKFYEIKQLTNEKATIYLYGDVVDDSFEDETEISAIDFSRELKQLIGINEIEIRIQSYGGSVFAGVAIYNMLKNHPAKIIAHIDGVAASIASVISMSADTIIMPQNSMMMIHNPMAAISFGNSQQLRKKADDLDKIAECAITSYLDKSNGRITREKLIELLDHETWLSADECLKYGLCDEVTNKVELVAKFTESNVINKLENNPIKLEQKKEEKDMVMKLNKEDNLEELKEAREAFINKHQDYTEKQLLEDFPYYQTLVDRIDDQIKKEEDFKQEYANQRQQKNANTKYELPQEYEKNGQMIQVLTPQQKVVTTDASRYEQKEFAQMSIGKLVKGMATGNWNGAELEQQVVAANRDGSGGVLVPAPLSNELINMVRAQSVLMTAGARTVPMTSSTLVFAKQTGDVQPHWKEEGSVIVESDADFAPVKFEAKTLVGMADITIELLEDALNIDSIVTDSIVQALALELDRAGLLGAGTEIEPEGLYNRTGITKKAVGAALTSYKPFSEAITDILSANGTPNAVIYSPRTFGELDTLTDSTGQPLNAPKSYENLPNKLTTTQVHNNLGSSNDGSFAVLGDFTKLWYGIRTGVTIEVSRVAGDAFSNLKFKIRAYLRADVQPVHEPHFVILDDIK